MAGRVWATMLHYLGRMGARGVHVAPNASVQMAASASSPLWLPLAASGARRS